MATAWDAFIEGRRARQEFETVGAAEERAAAEEQRNVEAYNRALAARANVAKQLGVTEDELIMQEAITRQNQEKRLAAQEGRAAAEESRVATEFGQKQAQYGWNEAIKQANMFSKIGKVYDEWATRPENREQGLGAFFANPQIAPYLEMAGADQEEIAAMSADPSRFQMARDVADSMTTSGIKEIFEDMIGPGGERGTLVVREDGSNEFLPFYERENLTAAQAPYVNLAGVPGAILDKFRGQIVLPEAGVIGAIGTAAGARAAGTAMGEGAVAAQAGLPLARALHSDMRFRIQNVLESDYGAVVGLPTFPKFLKGGFGALDPQIWQTPAADAFARIEYLRSGAFRQAFESLKGAGAITEAEGKAATDALVQLSRTTSVEEFQRNLAIFQRELDRLLQLAEDKAARGEQTLRGVGMLQPGATATAPAPTPAPAAAASAPPTISYEEFMRKR